MSKFYDQLCQTFIRPARQLYNAYDLGQPITQKYKRTDFHVLNNRQHRIMCSFYMNSLNTLSPCIVYLHSLNGSRLESLSFIDKVIQKGFNFCSFDFSGTGLSQGKYVSLGFFQKYDILAVLQYISENFHLSKFILWGRSMGAAAAIKFMNMKTPSSLNKSKIERYQIDSIVLDSPFHSLSQLAVQIAKQKIKIPQIFIKAILLVIQSSIQSKAGFKLSQMQLLQDVKSIKCPVLLLTSRDDKLVLSSHSQKIYQTILHKDRQIIFIKGQHNQNRQADAIEYILQFAKNSLNKKKSKINSKQSQNLQKSSKLFYNYKYSNNLIGSSAIAAKSNPKLENISDVVRYDTCGDEDQIVQKQTQKQLYKETQKYRYKQKLDYNLIQGPSYTVQKQHISQSIDSVNYTMKNNVFKKSLNLCSPKIDKHKYKQKNKTKNSQIKYQSRDLTTEIKNIVFRPNNEQKAHFEKKIILTENKSKTDIKNEIIFQYQSEKKILSNDNINKISLQINRSPTKDPPRLGVVKDNFSTPISKQSGKVNYGGEMSKQLLGQNLTQSQKVEIKNYENRKFHVEVISAQPQDKIVGNIEVNHFNIINQKLKRKKKKQLAGNQLMKLTEIKDNRGVSISIQRKCQIPIKSPPQLMKLKLFDEEQQRREKNI